VSEKGREGEIEIWRKRTGEELCVCVCERERERERGREREREKEREGEILMHRYIVMRVCNCRRQRR
jgi:hypothetical protein